MLDGTTLIFCRLEAASRTSHVLGITKMALPVRNFIRPYLVIDHISFHMFPAIFTLNNSALLTTYKPLRCNLFWTKVITNSAFQFNFLFLSHSFTFLSFFFPFSSFYNQIVASIPDVQLRLKSNKNFPLNVFECSLCFSLWSEHFRFQNFPRWLLAL